jgi:hypothetical protein
MPETMENPETPREQDPAKDSKEAAEKRLDRMADKAAERAGKSETSKDESTGVVTW